MTGAEWWEMVDREIAEGKRCGVGGLIRCAEPMPCPTHRQDKTDSDDFAAYVRQWHEMVMPGMKLEWEEKKNG